MYRIAHHFVADGTAGLVDHREDNGPTKVTAEYASDVLAAGALDHTTGRLHWVEGRNRNSALFIALVDDLLRSRYRDQKVIPLMMLDNFKIHSSKAVQGAAARWGRCVPYHFL